MSMAPDSASDLTSELLSARAAHDQIEETREASVAQRRACVDQELYGPATSHLQWAIRIEGQLRVEALQRAWEALVRLMPALRTTLLERSGELQQVTFAASAMHFARTLAPPLRVSDVQRFASELGRRPLDLARGLPWRIALVVEPELGAHTLVVVQHTALCDAQSIRPQVELLARLYGAELGSSRAPDPFPIALPCDETAGATHEHWQRRLDGLSELSLPRDGSVVPGNPDVAVREPLGDPAALGADVERLAAASRTSGPAVVLAGFAALLHRYTGQTDIAVAAELPGQAKALTAGLSMRTTVVRCQLESGLDFANLANEVGRQLEEAHRLAPLSLDEIARTSPAGNEVYGFPARFAWSPGVGGELYTAETCWRPFTFTSDARVLGTASCDLRLACGQAAGALTGAFVYRPSGFSPTVGASIAEHLTILLQAAAGAPESQVDRLPLLTAREQKRLLESWNDTARPYPLETPFQALFAEQARRTPERVAVSAGASSLTYAELDVLAGRVARRLRAASIGRDRVVGVLMQRSVEFVASVLGILKAGGAFLPIDPAYPAQRQRQILRASRCAIVIADATVDPAVVGATQDAGRPGAVNCTPEWVRITELAEGSPAEGSASTDARDTDLAYVIYTSGSTGTPKGAMVEQRGMVNHLFAKIDYLSLGEEDVVVQNASQSFDIAVWQSLAALLVGGRVEVVDDDLARDPASLLSLVRQRAVSVLEVVPSFLSSILDFAASRDVDLASLRWLLVTGEALPPELCKRWLERFPEIPVVNAYGPTECSDDVTHHTLRDASDVRGPHVPIGKPIGNTRLYVLDRHLEPVPIGVAGELAVAGDCVGRGYLGAAGQTDEAFLAHGLARGKRLYRTGDRVRYTADGELVFLGRRDEQVKIRGYRIEVDEISAVLAKHPAVQRAVVVAGETSAGGKQLVGFWTARQPSSASGLQAHLAELLPAYMVPAELRRVDAFPLTPNGKIDRQALARMARSHDPEPLVDRISRSQSPLEEVLCHVWADALGSDRVDPEAPLADLGADAVSALDAAVRARHVLGTDLATSVALQARRVREMVHAVDAAWGTAAAIDVAPLGERFSGRSSLSVAQELLISMAGGQAGLERSSERLAVMVYGELQTDALAAALDHILERHRPLRMTLTATEHGAALQLSNKSKTVPLERLAVVDGDASALGDRFSLAEGPLLHARVTRHAADEHLLVLAAHRLAADARSMRLILRELVVLYDVYANGQVALLPEPSVDYAAYARAERAAGAAADSTVAIGFWQRQWGQCDARHPAPRPPPDVCRTRSLRLPLELDSRLTASLRRLCRNAMVSLHSALFAAYSVLLHRWTGEFEVTIGAAIENRRQLWQRDAVGAFALTVPLRAELRGDVSVAELLRRTREVELAAFCHVGQSLLQGLVHTRRCAGPFLATFSLESALPAPLPGKDTRWVAIDAGSEGQTVEVSLRLREDRDRLVGDLLFGSDALDPVTGRQWVDGFQTLAHQISADQALTLDEMWSPRSGRARPAEHGAEA